MKFRRVLIPAPHHSRPNLIPVALFINARRRAVPTSKRERSKSGNWGCYIDSLKKTRKKIIVRKQFHFSLSPVYDNLNNLDYSYTRQTSSISCDEEAFSLKNLSKTKRKSTQKRSFHAKENKIEKAERRKKISRKNSQFSISPQQKPNT